MMLQKVREPEYFVHLKLLLEKYVIRIEKRTKSWV